MKLKIKFFIDNLKYLAKVKLHKIKTHFLQLMGGDKKGYLVISVVIILTLIINAGSENPTSTRGDNAQVNQQGSSPIDTHIPKGFVLVPVELVNFNSIRGIIGALAVVDLYLQRNSKSKLPVTVPIVKSIRLIQAPNNNNQVAILVPESKANLFLGEKKFFATIQNPKNYKTIFYKKSKLKPRRLYINQNKDI